MDDFDFQGYVPTGKQYSIHNLVLLACILSTTTIQNSIKCIFLLSDRLVPLEISFVRSHSHSPAHVLATATESSLVLFSLLLCGHKKKQLLEGRRRERAVRRRSSPVAGASLAGLLLLLLLLLLLPLCIYFLPALYYIYCYFHALPFFFSCKLRQKVQGFRIFYK